MNEIKGWIGLDQLISKGEADIERVVEKWAKREIHTRKEFEEYQREF